MLKACIAFSRLLAFSRRSLSKAEVSSILQIDPTMQPYIKSTKIFWNRLLTACSSLITISSADGSTSSKDNPQEIRLAHFSVKEYLMSETIRNSKMNAFFFVQCNRKSISRRDLFSLPSPSRKRCEFWPAQPRGISLHAICLHELARPREGAQ